MPIPVTDPLGDKGLTPQDAVVSDDGRGEDGQGDSHEALLIPLLGLSIRLRGIVRFVSA